MRIFFGCLLRTLLLTFAVAFTAFCTVITHGNGTGSAITNFTDPVHVSVSAGAHITPIPGVFGDSAFASQTYSSTVRLTFEGLQGSGYYVPCLTASASHDAQAAARFDGVSLFNYGFGFARTCTTIGLADRANWIPFIYGQPQTVSLYLHADASASGGPSQFSFVYDNGGNASIAGFTVLDLRGNPIAATWTAVDASVPEPGQSIPLLVALGFGYACRMRRKEHRVA